MLTKTAVDAYMVQRGFEDEDGTVLKPFHDRVIRPSDPEYGKPETADSIMEHADGAFAGKPDIAAVPVASAGEPDDLSYHARSTRRKSNTAAEILPEGWYHAGVRPAEHVSCPTGCWKSQTRWRTATIPPASTIRNTKCSKAPIVPRISAHGWWSAKCFRGVRKTAVA